MAATIAFVVTPMRVYTVAATAGLLLTLLIYHPARPQAVVSSTGFVLTYNAEPEELFYSVGQ